MLIIFNWDMRLSPDGHRVIWCRAGHVYDLGSCAQDALRVGAARVFSPPSQAYLVTGPSEEIFTSPDLTSCLRFIAERLNTTIRQLTARGAQLAGYLIRRTPCPTS